MKPLIEALPRFRVRNGKRLRTRAKRTATATAEDKRIQKCGTGERARTGDGSREEDGCQMGKSGTRGRVVGRCRGGGSSEGQPTMTSSPYTRMLV